MKKILKTTNEKKSFLLGFLITSLLSLSLFYVFPIVKSYENSEIRCIKAPCPSTFNMTISDYIKESKLYINYLKNENSSLLLKTDKNSNFISETTDEIDNMPSQDVKIEDIILPNGERLVDFNYRFNCQYKKDTLSAKDQANCEMN